MNANKSKEILAREILEIALEQWVKLGERHGHPNDVLIAPDGEPCVVYEGESKHGYGAILCYYKPRKAVEKILSECEKRFDDSTMDVYLIDEERTKQVRLGDRDWGTGVREKIINQIASEATMFLLMGLKVYFGDAIEAIVKDSGLYTDAVISSLVIGWFEDSHIKVNLRSAIEERVTETVKNKRKRLTRLINSVPRLHIQTSAGRPQGSTKSEKVKSKERAEFVGKIESAIETLNLKRQRITKTAIAKVVGCGGLNHRTGSDTALRAFNNKIRRLGIDYNAILAKSN